jgi:hypothetical protein
VAGKSAEQWEYVRTYQAKQNKNAASMSKEEIHKNFAQNFGTEQFLYCKQGATAITLTEDDIKTSLYDRKSPMLLGLANHSYVMYGYDPETRMVFTWDPLAGRIEYKLEEVNGLFEGQLEIFHSFAPK